MVNGPALGGTRLLLSNWPGVPTSANYLADTGVETVLRYLKSAGASGELSGVEAATSVRFDAGSLLALWALLNREAALAQEDKLVAAARAAEFGVSTNTGATNFVLTIAAYQHPQESPLGAEVLELPEPRRDAALYEALLPQVGAMLKDIKRFELLWIGEYTDVLQSESLLNSGAVAVESVPDLDLVVLDTPLGLHPLVRLTVSAGRSRLLQVRSENTYSLEYRYESWVQYQSYRPPPRLSLVPLATRLNMFERREGGWRAEPVSQPRPRLFFDGGSGRPSPSSIDRETVVEEMLGFLREHRSDPALLWSPYSPGA